MKRRPAFSPSATKLGVGIAIVTLLAGCADDATTPPAQVGSSDAQAASGEPLSIGFINQEASSTVSYPDLGRGTAAAVEYINAELGGVGGRPIKLEKCITNGSPESSAACANQMVEKGVVAVRGGIDKGGAASLPILEAAGIPYVGMVPLVPSDFTSRGAFAFETGSPGNVASAVYIAETLKAKRVSIIHSDSSAGTQLATVFLKEALIQRGLREDDILLVPEKETAPDLSPALAKANEHRPDAIMVGLVPPTCIRVMQAAAALGVTASMFYTPPCGDPAVLRAGGPGAQNAYFVSPLLHVGANADDPEVRLYLEKAKRYGAEDMTVDSLLAITGFSATMNLRNLLERIGPDRLNGPAIFEALRSEREQPNFMSHPYTCDGNRLGGLVSLCVEHVRLFRFTDGRVVDVQGDWILTSTAPGG